MEVQSPSDVLEKLMLPPPPGTFQDREGLIQHVREFGASQGYVVTIKKSRRDRRVILGCDRGGVYRNRRKINESKRKRKACTRLINCPFEAIGKKDDDVWVLTVRNGDHNHEPLRDMSEHPYSRRFTGDEVRQIKVMTEAGIKPRQVLEALKQSNPDLQSTPRHLYNLKAKIRQGKLPENIASTDKNLVSWRPSRSTSVSTSTEASSRQICPMKVPNYIGGNFIDSEACDIIDVINPATQEVASQVPLSTYEEFKAAVGAAKQAFPAWRNTPVTVRQRIMFKFQELIRRDIDKLVMNIAVEQGKTLKGAKGDVLRGLEVVEQSCGMATLQMGEFIPNATCGVDTFCIREPLGVCAGICPSNLPAMISLWMFPIAVTCGNTFVLKPSVKNPGVSMILAALAAEAGLPDGVLNVVHGTQEIINYICDDDDIKAISLVGSNSAGMHTYARAAVRGKRVQSNMGAKNHAIIMPDASADVTLDAIIAAGFGAAGQRCMTLSTAIFVGGSSPWEQELVDRTKRLKVNAGTEAGADLGPVISKSAKDQICRLVENGVESGGRLILDGRNIVVPRYEQGNFVGPTILCDVTTDMECYQEEMYGPVLLCMQADSLEEAIVLVNKNRYCNGATIFTTSGVSARKFQNDVESGLVGINVPVPIPLPFSSVNGSKTSFSGDLNFCGKAGVQFYTHIKTVAQQWRDLPARRISFSLPPTLKTETSNGGVSIKKPPSPESDRPSREVSPAFSLASDNFLPFENVYVPLPPSEEDLPNPEVFPYTSTSERELPMQEGSCMVASALESDSNNQEVSAPISPTGETDSAKRSGSLCSRPASKETYLLQAQWSESSNLVSQKRSGTIRSTSEGIYVASSSQIYGSLPQITQRKDFRKGPKSENLYFPASCSNGTSSIFYENENSGPASFRKTASVEGPKSERLYFPASCTTDIVHMFGGNGNEGPASFEHDLQRTDMMNPSSVSLYVPVIAHFNKGAVSQPDNIHMEPRNDLSIHSGSCSLNTPTSGMSAMPPSSDKICLFSEGHSNERMPSLERLFMRASSREAYALDTIMSTHDYHDGQGELQSFPAAQDL